MSRRRQRTGQNRIKAQDKTLLAGRQRSAFSNESAGLPVETSGRSVVPPSDPPKLSRWIDAFVTWLFRFFTLISVGYLVYDRYYETAAVITAQISDAADPFYYPFSLTNTSHLFNISNLSWECHLVDAIYENNGRIQNTTITTKANRPLLAPGSTTNLHCNRNTISFGNTKIMSAKVKMQASYDVDVFGLWKFHRLSEPVIFSWLPGPTESRRQWLRGEP